MSFGTNRNVVQPGRTLRSGRRGRWFESSHSDQHQKAEEYTSAFFVFYLIKFVIRCLNFTYNRFIYPSFFMYLGGM